MSLLTKEQLSRTSNPAAFGNNTFFAPERIELLRSRIISGLTPRMQKKWVIIQDRSAGYTPLGPLNPWYLPENYGATPEEAAARAEALHVIETDSATAADLALRYQLRLPSDPATPSQLAAGVVRILTAWLGVTTVEQNPSSMLNWNELFPVFLQAAIMVRDAPEYTTALDNGLKALSLQMYEMLSTRNGNFLADATSTADNNWAAWGITCMIAIAAFLGNRAMFDSAIFRWRQQFTYSIKSNWLGVDGLRHDNVPIYEVYRQGGGYGDGSYGLLYSNHDFNAKVLGAEWARINGEFLYSYESPDGSSLRGLWEEIVKQTRTVNATTNWYNTSSPPTRFTWNRMVAGVPIMNDLWGSADSAWLVANRDIYSGSTVGASDSDFDGLRNADLVYRPVA